jgi:hypothetical protein
MACLCFSISMNYDLGANQNAGSASVFFIFTGVIIHMLAACNLSSFDALVVFFQLLLDFMEDAALCVCSIRFAFSAIHSGQ